MTLDTLAPPHSPDTQLQPEEVTRNKFLKKLRRLLGRTADSSPQLSSAEHRQERALRQQQLLAERREFAERRELLILGGKLPRLKDRMPLHSSRTIEAYVSDIHNKPTDETVRVSEAEAAEDYFDFLSRVREVTADSSEQDNLYVEGINVRNAAEMFAEESVIMTLDDFDTACKGLASRHADFLREDDSNELYFFVSETFAQKSQGMMTDKMQQAIVDQIGDASTDRISLLGLKGSDDASEQAIIQHLSTKNPDNVRIVIADDWAVSGKQMDSSFDRFRDICRGLPQLDDSPGLLEQRLAGALEYNFALMRADQKASSFGEFVSQERSVARLPNPIRIVGYYEAPEHSGKSLQTVPMPSGMHTVVDYDFATILEIMREYGASRQPEDFTRLPYISTIKRSYRDWHSYAYKHLESTKTGEQ